MTRRCPYCNQELPEYRMSVRLPPLKARIFDAVRDAGRDGISWDDLYWLVYGDPEPETLDRGRGAPKSAPRRKQNRTALKAHIHQINEAIAHSGYRITGQRNGVGGIYRLTQREKQTFTLSPRETIRRAS